jgi:hypothetical protein
MEQVTRAMNMEMCQKLVKVPFSLVWGLRARQVALPQDGGEGVSKHILDVG